MSIVSSLPSRSHRFSPSLPSSPSSSSHSLNGDLAVSLLRPAGIDEHRTGGPMALDIIDIKKTFGDFEALSGISLGSEPGEFLALLGPSGSGKTTLLRILAGLEVPDSGQLVFDGEDLL